MRSSEQFLCLPGNGYGWNEYMLYGSRKRNKKRFIASDVTRFFLLAFYMCGFLHAFVSAFIGFCISSFPYFGLPAFLYVYHLIHCICYAFLHFCISALLVCFNSGSVLAC